MKWAHKSPSTAQEGPLSCIVAAAMPIFCQLVLSSAHKWGTLPGSRSALQLSAANIHQEARHSWCSTSCCGGSLPYLHGHGWSTSQRSKSTTRSSCKPKRMALFQYARTHTNQNTEYGKLALATLSCLTGSPHHKGRAEP